MRDRPACWMVVLGMALTVSESGTAEEPLVDVKGIRGLVGRLGSDRYVEREAAAHALEVLGAPALEALRAAARSPDAEVRRRAIRLVQQIEKRLEMRSLLAPQRVRLTYRETPLAEAVADFGKQTGVALALPPDGDRVELIGRKVTLDTGTVSFWEALDQFCSRAGLVQSLDTSAQPRDSNRGTTSGSIVVFGRVIRQTEPTDVLRPAPDDKPAGLRLLAGKVTPLPTHYAGAVRVQAVPLDRLGEVEKSEGEKMVALEVTVEPTLQWQRVLDLRLHKAVDEQGRALTPLPVALPSSAYASRQATVWVRGQPVTPSEEPVPPGPQQLPVRLRVGEKPPRQLQELAGTLLLQLQTPVQPLVTVDNIRKPTNRTIRGTADTSVRVLEVSVTDAGQVDLRVHVEATPRNLRDNTIMVSNYTVIVDGRVVGDEPALNSSHFSLLDEQGMPFRAVKAMATGKRAGAAQEYELSYQPGAKQGPAARFVYRDRRTVLVEVPFTLKDVPLP